MKGGGIQQQTLDKYNYKKDKPLFSSNNYTVYSAVNKQTNVPVTIKILKYPHVELGRYLKQMKDLKSQYVIRIFELVAEQSILILVTEQARFGNMKKALTKPQRLDQNDAIFIGKILLSGHAQLLRSDINWFGTEQDIEFTDSGIKLSWNNGCSFNLVNPFPIIINRLYNRAQIVSAQNVSILPFPPSKTINQLAKISKENASQISMSPQMKKKEKITKKKGKDWLGLKQYKNKNQYFDELTYFAVSDQYGFVRVKIYDQGKISPNLLALNKTKQYFTKVIDIRQQGTKTTIISQYANDGNLQSYVTKLKANGITLKEDQIQFFIYSLFSPIKLVQQSSLMSINMLHIRNIYIQNGIPKIGQPIPINQRISQVLMDRSDVPDFYHSGFKRDPQSRNPIYDTYSLGVLLYKLMYTQYPIFPNQKVHIPTTPSYNKRLKTTLQIFLNEGGTLKLIQERIDVSDTVKKQVQQNQAKLMQGFQKKQVKQKMLQVQDQDAQESQKPPTVVSNSEQEDQPQQQEQEEQDYHGPTLYEMISKKLQLRPPQKSKEGQLFHFVDNLESSSFKNFRLWSKTVFVFCLYVFVFFYKFLSNVVNLVASQSLLTEVQVNISNVNYTIITTDKFNFQQVYNLTDKNLASLQSMNCLYQNYSSTSTGTYTSFINESSGIWIGYIMGGFAAFVLIMIIKAIQIHNFDQIKSLYKRHHGVSHFNVLNWFLFNLFWLNLLTSCYFLFNFIFYPQTEPCVGFSGGNIYGSTNALFNNHLQFVGLYVVIFLLQIFAIVCYLCVLASNDNFSPGYNFLLNPISVFGAILSIFFLIIRFGVILGEQYYPAAATDSQNIIKNIFENHDSVGIFGFLPQILFLIQIVIVFGVDFIYYGIVDKNKSLLGNQTSNVNQSLKDLI